MKMIKLDRTGDTVLEVDTQTPDGFAAAEAFWKKAVDVEKRIPINTSNDNDWTKMNKFDPEVKEVIFRQQFVGG